MSTPIPSIDIPALPKPLTIEEVQAMQSEQLKQHAKDLEKARAEIFTERYASIVSYVNTRIKDAMKDGKFIAELDWRWLKDIYTGRLTSTEVYFIVCDFLKINYSGYHYGVQGLSWQTEL